VRLVIAAAVAASVVVLAACGGTADRTAPEAAQPPASVPAVAASSAAPVTAPAPAVAASWKMPDLVGSGLQDAQDAVQGLTGFGIALTFSHDATGQGRHQVSDRNWKVCDQSVKPGATITADTRIDFGAVKLDEAC
jgi:hypothetical protein